jgi:hypothetical protein
MDVEMPDNGTGNILTVSGLRAAGDQDGDQIDARANTVIALEREPGGKLTGTVTRTFELFDDGDRDGDGALEPDGVFGNPQDDLASVEGHYSFHARAAYGDGCTGARETSWSTYVQVGIDPGQTGVSTESLGVFPDGQHVRVTFCPRDRFGNYLGPGRGGTFSVYSPAGSTLIGVLTDLGQRLLRTGRRVGSSFLHRSPCGYLATRPAAHRGRSPSTSRFSYSVKFLCGIQHEECGCAPVRPGHYATEINIHNFQDREVKIEKRILPLVIAGAARGREPGFTQPTAFDTIVLPRQAATMDDCCRITELLFGAQPAQPVPLTLGFLEIVSPIELKVTAVYTVSDLKSGSVSMDVATVEPQRVS